MCAQVRHRPGGSGDLRDFQLSPLGMKFYPCDGTQCNALNPGVGLSFGIFVSACRALPEA